MLDREATLEIVDRGFATRARGDKAALNAMLAPGATYALNADAGLLPGYPVGPVDAAGALSELIDQFTFHEFERLDAIVEGDKAAIRWRVSVSRGDGPREVTQIFELWTFDASGKVVSLVDFADTGLIARLLR
jgi:ketosteroid isomerase-like protein